MHVDPTAKLHAISGISLDPMTKSIAEKTWSESRIPKDLMTKSTAKSMIPKDPMIVTNVVANAIVDHVRYQVMLINGFSSKHSTISVCHWPRCCSAELSSRHKITVNC